MVIPYYKPLGMTPLEAIRKLQQEQSELQNTPITYAGRLDPMAEGLLLLLTGEDIKNKSGFLNLPKTYQATVLLGFSTDTYDILGIPEPGKTRPVKQEEIEQALRDLLGRHSFPYPVYSSKTVGGKPLWQIAREDELSGIDIPERQMELFDVQLLGEKNITPAQLAAEISKRIEMVTGDFRQNLIMEHWNRLLDAIPPNTELTKVDIRFEVSSGTYIRSLASELGKKLQTGATLFALKRTSIGDYLAPVAQS